MYGLIKSLRAISNNIAPQTSIFSSEASPSTEAFFRPRPQAEDEKMPRLRGWPRTKKCRGWGAILLDIAREDTVYTIYILLRINKNIAHSSYCSVFARDQKKASVIASKDYKYFTGSHVGVSTIRPHPYKQYLFIWPFTLVSYFRHFSLKRLHDSRTISKLYITEQLMYY